MKKLILVLLLLCVSFIYAQENFPYKNPELLLGKEVKVISTSESRDARLGYMGFYTDENFYKCYDPTSKHSSYSKPETLVGKTFKITDVKDVSTPDFNKVRLKLEGKDGLNLYYKYNYRLPSSYPFEVTGGLTLPDGFYCNIIEENTISPEWQNFKALVDIGTWVSKDIEKGKSKYYITFAIFLPKDSKPLESATLLLERQKTITVETDLIIPEFHDGKTFKYNFTMFLDKQNVALIAANKIIGVKIGDQVATITQGQKIQGVINCLLK